MLHPHAVLLSAESRTGPANLELLIPPMYSVVSPLEIPFILLVATLLGKVSQKAKFETQF